MTDYTFIDEITPVNWNMIRRCIQHFHIPKPEDIVTYLKDRQQPKSAAQIVTAFDCQLHVGTVRRTLYKMFKDELLSRKENKDGVLVYWT